MNNKHKTTIKLDDCQHKLLVDLCKQNNMSQNELLTKLIDDTANSKERCNPLVFMIDHEDEQLLNDYLSKNNISKDDLISDWIDRLQL